jgi:hypothetical protein
VVVLANVGVGVIMGVVVSGVDAKRYWLAGSK